VIVVKCAVATICVSDLELGELEGKSATWVSQMVLCRFAAICEPAYRATILIEYDLRWIPDLHPIQVKHCLVVLAIVAILRVLCHDAPLLLFYGLGYARPERIVATVFRLSNC